MSKYGTVLSIFAFVLVPILGCGGEAPSSGDPTASDSSTEESSGPLVIVGGALQSTNTAVYQAILDRRQGPGPLCVIPTASGTPRPSMESYVSTFDEMGGAGTAKGILLTVDNPGDADLSAVRAELESCSGYFFTGGSQSRVTEVFRPGGGTTQALEGIWSRFREGAVISGSSAGAAIMTDPMIAGGGSEEALRAGVRQDPEGEGVLLETGLGFLPVGLVDQHFLARGRWGRLLVALMGSDSIQMGFGIDENTALVVDGDSAQVVGESGVVFMDARGASPEDQGTGGDGVRLFLLGAGDRMLFEQGAVLQDPSKEVISGTGPAFSDSELDLFGDRVLLNVLFQFAISPDPRLTFQQDGHTVEFRKAPDFRAVAWNEPGIAETPRGLSLGPIALSVRRE